MLLTITTLLTTGVLLIIVYFVILHYGCWIGLHQWDILIGCCRRCGKIDSFTSISYSQKVDDADEDCVHIFRGNTECMICHYPIHIEQVVKNPQQGQKITECCDNCGVENTFTIENPI